jgi:hypothetical protein
VIVDAVHGLSQPSFDLLAAAGAPSERVVVILKGQVA